MVEIILFFAFAYAIGVCKDKISEIIKRRRSKKQRLQNLDREAANLKKKRQELYELQKKTEAEFKATGEKLASRENEIALREERLTARENKKDLRKEDPTAKENEIALREERLSAKENEITLREERLTAKENEINFREEKTKRQEAQIKETYERSSHAVSRLVFGLPRETPVSEWPAPLRVRLFHAATDDITIEYPISFSASVVGTSGDKYATSLNHCTCEDYRRHGTPCKHMIYLALCIGWNCFETENPAKEQLKKIEQMLLELNKEGEKIKREQIKSKALKSDIEKISNEKQQSYPWLSHMIADLYTKYDEDLATALRSKRNPAIKAAESVQRISKDLKAALVKQKQLEYQLAVYENAFPFLEEFKEIPPKSALNALNIVCDNEQEYDHSRDWISKEEYEKLSEAERDQLALERYTVRSKSSWEVGIEYEQYIGHLCEIRGYQVSYTGATKGLEDMGQDLVLRKGKICYVIQCKRWNTEKVIHEKHIFQLYGSVVTSQIESPGIDVSGVFVSTTTLSPLALECAKKLQIQVFEQVPMGDFPRIKCNLSHSGEKIYHLPYDQQYNTIRIEPEKGEFFANTVQEAIDAGFRRAFRWHSQKSD